MPQTVGTLKKSEAKPGIDRKFLAIAIALELELQRRLDDVSSQMNAQVQNYTRADKIQDQKTLSDALALTLAAYTASLYKGTVQAVHDVAQAKAELAASKILPSLQQAGATDWVAELKAKLATYPNQVAQRFPYKRQYGTTFTQHIKTVQSGFEKTVRNIVDNGVNSGLSSSQIAKQIEQYVNPVPGMPRTQPFAVYRERFGRPVSYTPPGVPAGTVQYNTMRIARSETANAYRQSTLDFYKDTDYIDHYEWVLSGSHPEVDVCDDYADQNPYKDVTELPSAPHPFCMCDIVAITKSVGEIKSMYNDD